MDIRGICEFEVFQDAVGPGGLVVESFQPIQQRAPFIEQFSFLRLIDILIYDGIDQRVRQPGKALIAFGDLQSERGLAFR